jgi:hypothetical protein
MKTFSTKNRAYLAVGLVLMLFGALNLSKGGLFVSLFVAGVVFMALAFMRPNKE